MAEQANHRHMSRRGVTRPTSGHRWLKKQAHREERRAARIGARLGIEVHKLKFHGWED